jgi:hypothetical protein
MMFWLENRRNSAHNQNTHTLDYIMLTKMDGAAKRELETRLSNPRFPDGTSMHGNRWLGGNRRYYD